MRLAYSTLDVFTDRRFGGNPLAVVHGAGGLSDEEMLAIAREFNLSETVFILPAENLAHSARMRIFTPVKELPFAGHPTVGTAALLAENKFGQGRDADAMIVLEEGIGTLRVGVRLRKDHAPYAEFDAPKVPVEAGSLPPIDVLAAALTGRSAMPQATLSPLSPSPRAKPSPARGSTAHTGPRPFPSRALSAHIFIRASASTRHRRSTCACSRPTPAYRKIRQPVRPRYVLPASSPVLIDYPREPIAG